MKRFFWLVVFSVFAVPISCMIPLMGTDVWYVQFLALFSCGLLGVSLVLWKFNKYLSIFTIICLFSTITANGSIDWTRGVVIANQDPASVWMLCQFYLACLAIYGISLFNENQRRWILRAIVGIAIIQGLYVVIQYFNLDPIFNLLGDPSKDDTVGLSGSHNQIGLFLSVTSPLILSVCPLAFPLMIFGIWCSTTSFAWVGLIVSNLFISWFISKKVFCGVAVVLILASIVFFTEFDNYSDEKFQERKDLYIHTTKTVLDGKIRLYKKKGDIMIQKIITCNSWLGYGFGSFIRISPLSQTFMKKERMHRYSHAHNDYLEVFSDMGKIGFISLMLIIFNFFYLFWKAEKTKILLICFACILAHMINALGIFTVHTANSGLLLILFYGVFMGEIRCQDEQKQGHEDFRRGTKVA